MPPVRIRPLRQSDLTSCAAIVAGEPLWRRYGISERRARGLLAAAARRRDLVYVAEHRSGVIGFVWFQLDGTFAHSGYVRWIGTAAEARRKGIGSALMKFAEQRILRRGPNVFLLVSDFNRRAQRFYHARGYGRVGALKDYVIPGVTELIYRKTVAPITRRRAVRFVPRRTAKGGQS